MNRSPTVLLNPQFGDFTDLRVPPITSEHMPPTGPWFSMLNALTWASPGRGHELPLPHRRATAARSGSP